MVVVLTVSVTALQVTWGMLASRKCARMGVLAVVVVMESLENVSVMLGMVGLIVHNQFVLIVKMENVGMTQLVCAKLAGKGRPVLRRLVTPIVHKMVGSVGKVTACVLPVSLGFSVRPKLTFVQTTAMIMVFVMSGASSAIVMEDLLDLIVGFWIV